MSCLVKFFGGKKKDKRSLAKEDVIQKLRSSEDFLMQRQVYLENQIEHEIAVAKRNSTTNKIVAVHALKRKKQYEKQLAEITSTILAITRQREAVDIATTNSVIMTSVKTTVDALKKTKSTMNVNNVQALMDDLTELHDLSKEITEAMINPTIYESDTNEDQLKKELEELELEKLDKEPLNKESRPVTDCPMRAAPTFRTSGRGKGKKKVKSLLMK